MQKFMLGCACVVVVFTAVTPAFAREIKQVVGYVETETTLNDRDAEFRKIDTSGDGAINFKEFQKKALLENEYAMFKMNDTNNDDLLTIDEYRVFSKQGPARATDNGPAMTHYNFNAKGSHY